MKYKHLIIEAYCDGETKCYNEKYPCNNSFKLKAYCLECNAFNYAPCPNEIAISNSDGVVEKSDDWIGFDEEMIPKEIINYEKYNESYEKYAESWRLKCKEKMYEASELYMRELRHR